MRIINKLKNAILISKVGYSYKSKFLLFYFYLWWPTVKRIMGKDPSGEFKVHIAIPQSQETAECYINNLSDFSVFKEMFVNQEYAFEIKHRPRVIIDLGSNVGFSVIFFKLIYPNAKIYAFEAAPKVYNKLLKNIRQFNGDVQAFNCVVGDNDANTTFFVDPVRQLSSSLVKRTNSVEKITIQSRTLDRIIDKIGTKIDLIKFDIEGAEYAVFKNSNKFLQVPVIFGEVHLDLIKENTNIERFASLFAGFYVNVLEESPDRFIFFAQKVDI